MSIFRWLPIVRRLEAENANLHSQMRDLQKTLGTRNLQLAVFRQRVIDTCLQAAEREANGDLEPERARLIVDHIKWLDNKLVTGYGAKVTYDLAKVDLGAVLRGARERGAVKEGAK